MQAQSYPKRQEVLTLAAQLSTLKTTLYCAQARPEEGWIQAGELDPSRRAQELILGALIAQVLNLQGWKWSKTRLSLVSPTLEQATSCHRGSGKCGLSTH